ncbi:MAG TPA: DUF2382 domain-containing protein [Thermomicrobiales bacterium]|nr:DUF2382 domain-containing protein [Thermomicrobiales bacterium]
MGYTATDIITGAEVFGADGDKVGTVAAVYPGYLVVEKGFFFPTDYYIPMSAVASYDNDQVYLNVAKDAALQSGWDAQPTDLETARYDTAYDTTTATTDTLIGTETDRLAAARVATDEEIRIPVMEEELTATVRPQDAGAVRIEKDVVSEQRTLDVPVTEERVRVERRVVDRPVTAADADAFEETVIEVPLRTETVDLQKQARVAEEVVISKEAEQRTEQVSGTVRREEVVVDEDAEVDASIARDRGTGANPTI